MAQEIVIVAGPPGGGKSTYVQDLVAKGYARFNRDTLGGSLKAGGLSYEGVRRAFAQGTRTFVLDNVYASKASRALVIALGNELGLPVRCLWLDTTESQAQFFAARRQIQRYGKLFTAEDYKAHRDDPNMFPPAAQFAYWKQVEPAEMLEGFFSVEHIPVTITLGPEYTNKAVIFDFDGTLRLTKSGAKYPSDPSDIVTLPGRKEKLQALAAQGTLMLGASNQSGCSKAPGDPKYVSVANAQRCFEATLQMLGVRMEEVLFAPDPAGVPQTYFRKPCPGMGVYFIEKYKLNPSQCLYVGDRGEDKTFAARCGFQFQTAEEFFQ